MEFWAILCVRELCVLHCFGLELENHGLIFVTGTSPSPSSSDGLIHIVGVTCVCKEHSVCLDNVCTTFHMVCEIIYYYYDHCNEWEYHEIIVLELVKLLAS